MQKIEKIKINIKYYTILYRNIYIGFHNPIIMDFYTTQEDYKNIIINILINDLQNREEFDKKMTVLENSIDILQNIIENDSEQKTILFQELLDLLM